MHIVPQIPRHLQTIPPPRAARREFMNAYRRYRLLITQHQAQAARAQRYWTFQGRDWEALDERADGEDVAIMGVLRDLGLQILDRGTNGAVHLG